MKKILFLLVVFVYILFSSATDLLIDRHQSFFSMFFRPATKEISVNDGRLRMHAEISGQLRFNERENAVHSISKNGYWKYQRNDTVLYVKPSRTGIRYYLEIDGDEQPLNQFSRDYVASAVHEMIMWGVDTESHLERIYKNNGTGNVLGEINLLKTDHLRSTYLHYLLNRSKLANEEVANILLKLTQNISSNELKLSLLKDIISQYPLNTITESSYMLAIHGLQDGNGKTTLIRRMLHQDGLSEQGHLSLIETISSLNSPSQKMNLFRAWTEKQIPSQAAWILLLNESSIQPAHPAKTLLLHSIQKNKPANPELDSIFKNLPIHGNYQ